MLHCVNSDCYPHFTDATWERWGFPWSQCLGTHKRGKEGPLEALVSPIPSWLWMGHTQTLLPLQAPLAGPTALSLSLGKGYFYLSQPPRGSCETASLFPGLRPRRWPSRQAEGGLRNQAEQHEDEEKLRTREGQGITQDLTSSPHHHSAVK